MIHPVDAAPGQGYGDNPTSIIRPGSVDWWIIEKFGNYQPDGHTGTDYPCPVGTPVRAVTAGRVVHVGRFAGSYLDNGYWIAPAFAGFVYVVDHGWFFGIYAHCMDGGARVKVGDEVAEGQVLGLSGNTGASTGAHLHFEALRKGAEMNSTMYGRFNPATLFGAVVVQGNTTQEEDELVAITDDDARKIARFLLDEVVTTEPDKKPTTLRWFLASQRQGRREDVEAVLQGIFGRKFKVEGAGEVGETSLGAEVGWFRNNFRRAQK